MTIRLPSSVPENIWSDGERVSESDLKLEQDHIDQTISALINNHFGSGVLPSNLTSNILFDSNILSADQVALVAANIFDGTGIQVAQQPSDINLGNQLEITLTGSNVGGRKSIKVAIIGVSFDGSIQMDRLYFYKNETQVTSKHYKNILAIFFNNFKGNSNCSANLGGQIIVKEARSFEISRDALMVAQDVEPDIFWRDFRKPTTITTLAQTIQNGIGPTFSVDALNINTTSLPNKRIEAGDVTTQIGQKFQTKTNNIQKITLLLSVDKLNGVAENHVFDWAGDIIISIYPLQTSVACISDIVPGLPIEFDPAIVPLAQTSFNMSTLQDAGYLLNDVLQPVDFVFSNTKIGSTNGITTGDYFALTIKRSGSAVQNAIQVGVGGDRLSNSNETIFSNGVWVDVPQEDLWFQVWTDAIKISDGSGYDAGNGIFYPKITTDESTGALIDNEKINFSFSDTGRNNLNIAVIQAVLNQFGETTNERTGNSVVSQQQFVPQLSLLTVPSFEILSQTTEPLVVGGVKDTNPKNNPVLDKMQNFPGLANGNQFCIINPDADLLSLNLVGSKLIPNKNNTSVYKIVKETLCTNLYGNPSGTGIISQADISLITSLIGESLFSSSTTSKIYDGHFTTIQLLQSDLDGDGYITANDANLITEFVSKSIATFPVGSEFTSLCLTVEQNIGRYDGYYVNCDGYIDGYSSIIAKISDLSIYQIEADGYLISPVINSDPAFSNIPFIPVNFNITPEPFWQPHLIQLSSNAKFVPAAFTYLNQSPQLTCGSSIPVLCNDPNENPPEIDPGRNDIYIPDNLILDRGNILRPDGSFYKNDLEICIIELRLPEDPLNQVNIDIFSKFIRDRGDGKTIANFPAMKYADCSTVQPEDLSLGRVKIVPQIAAFVPSLDGYSDLGQEIIIDPIIGLSLDYNTGILTLALQDLKEDKIFISLVTKIIITVYLKKAGFNNPTLIVTSDQIEGLIS